MAEDEPKRPDRATKAQNLLRRFPVTDLAKAVALTGEARRTFLTDFVDGYSTLSYFPTRRACPMIYGATPPLLEIPPEPWEEVEKHLTATTNKKSLGVNLAASRKVFDLVRSQGYLATVCPEQVLRVALKQVVPIGINLYVTKGRRVLFQFPQPRLDSPDDNEARVLGSIVHHAYAQGDYAIAEIEIVDVGRAPGEPRRSTKRKAVIRPVPRDQILNLPQLTEQIDDVYAVLRELAARPRHTK